MKSWLKATIAVSLTAAVSLGLSGCANPNGTPTPTAFVPHIAVILGNEGPSYAATLEAAAEAAAKKYGAILDWHGETLNGTAKQQNALLEKLAAKQVEGYILMPIDDSVQAYNDMAASTHADVINFDAHVPTLTKVFANLFDDANQGGIKLADSIADSMGYATGKSFEIAVGVINPNEQVTKTRLAGLNYELGAKYPGIKVVATAVSGANANKAATQVEKAFTANPKLAGFVALDEFTATAAAAYVQQHSVKVPLVAYDATPDHVALLKKGIFTHLLSQNPAQRMALAIELIAKHQTTGALPAARDQIFESVMLDKSSSKGDLKKYSYAPAK